MFLNTAWIDSDSISCGVTDAMEKSCCIGKAPVGRLFGAAYRDGNTQVKAPA
jgi:hypothetical protein